MKKWILFLALVGEVMFVASCGGTLRSNLVAYANATTTAANASAQHVAERYCAASMEAMHRRGTWTSGRCVADGPEAGRPATPAEQEALAGVRSTWRPVVEAQELVAVDLDAIRTGLDMAEQPNDAHLLELLSALVAAYGALVRVAGTVGLTLPSLEVAR